MAAPTGMLDQLTDVSGTMFEGRLILIGSEYCSLECKPGRPFFEVTWSSTG